MSEEEVTSEVVTRPSNDIDSRLFNLRMKINQGRKANTAEVQEEVAHKHIFY